MKKLFSIILFGTLIIPSISNSQLKPIDYQDENQKLSGLLSIPKNGIKSNPGILILPAWMGIDEHAKESAVELSKLGYITFVADIYGVGNKPTNYSEAGKKAGYFKKSINEYHKRIKLALDQLVLQGANADNIVVIGYCFGGTGAIEAARINMKVKGIVSFHGGLGREVSRSIEQIIPRVLVLHGADDPYENEVEIKAFQNEMRTAKADWEMVYYSNAVHSFTDKGAGTDNSKGAAYNENADRRSWKAMVEFLKEVL